MRRKQIGVVAALVAIGAVALSACGTDSAVSGAAAPPLIQDQVAAQGTSQPEVQGIGKPASTVTFFTGKNFDDFSGNNFATGVSVGVKCADLSGGFRSLNTSGAVKIWSEPGCKGKSAVVSKDVRDTATLGLPKGARSYIRP